MSFVIIFLVHCKYCNDYFFNTDQLFIYEIRVCLKIARSILLSFNNIKYETFSINLVLTIIILGRGYLAIHRVLPLEIIFPSPFNWV